MITDHHYFTESKTFFLNTDSTLVWTLDLEINKTLVNSFKLPTEGGRWIWIWTMNKEVFVLKIMKTF